jgi:hypothetical protein
MTKPTRRKKRSKFAVALLSPILAIVFVVGWSLSWIGQPKAKQQQKPIIKTQATQDKDSIELIVIPMQEEQILEN